MFLTRSERRILDRDALVRAEMKALSMFKRHNLAVRFINAATFHFSAVNTSYSIFMHSDARYIRVRIDISRSSGLFFFFFTSVIVKVARSDTGQARN